MKIHFKIPTWGSLMLCLLALAFIQTASCQSIVDRIAYQTGIGAASRARANGLLLPSVYYPRGSEVYRQQDAHHRLNLKRSFTGIRVKKLHRIFTRIKLNRIKIKFQNND